MRDLIILFLSFVYSIIQSQEINYHQIEPIGLLEPYNSISLVEDYSQLMTLP